jgi:hypothetical protein
MKLRLLGAVLVLSAFAVAQHAGGHGPGGMGSGASMNRGNSGMHADKGGMGSGHEMPGTQHQGPRAPVEILSQNTKLSGNIEKLLPSGMTAQQACSGFKNLGECVSAIHVSRNLDIPFADLKARTTGANSESLGKAIGDLKPSADAKSEAKKAKRQASEDLKNNS